MNIILLTHGEFAKGIKNSLEMIIGKKDNIDYLSITQDSNISDVEDLINKKISDLNSEDPILILTDIIGGSTTQTAIKVINNRNNIYLVSGLNLGLLLEMTFLELTDDNNKNCELINGVIEQNKDSICLINNTINLNDDLDKEIDEL